MELRKKNIILILILIILAQIIIRIYIGNEKEYFHMDEAYSYGLMNYNKLNIADNEDFYNKWHNSNYYKDYLEVNRNEKWNLKPVYENQKNDVHPPLYYFLLRVFATFSIDNFSKWTGIILNIIIFIISSIFVYLISNQLFKNKIYSLLVCAINGFTLISLESSIYIRMYELSNLNILVITYLHLKIYNEKQLDLKQLFPIIISLIIGGLTHYYYFIYVFALFGIFEFKYIKTRDYKNLIKYTVSIIISAIIYLIIFPYAINHILFGYRGISNNSGIIDFIKNMGIYLLILSKGITNNLILIIIGIVYLICRKKEKINIKKNNKILILVIPILLYFIIISENSPYKEIRYVIPIYSISTICLIYLLKIYLRRFWDNKSTLFILGMIFIVILYSPKITGQKLEFTYKKYNNISSKIEEKNIPIVYVFNRNNNRFLDDIYLFTLVNKSVIIDYDKLNEYTKFLTQNDNFILMYNDGCSIEKIKSYIPDYEPQYIQKMNSCDIINMRK